MKLGEVALVTDGYKYADFRVSDQDSLLSNDSLNY